MAKGKDILLRLIKSVSKNSGSDILFQAGHKPAICIGGRLVHARLDPLAEDDFNEISEILLENGIIHTAANMENEVQGTLVVEGTATLAFNSFQSCGKPKISVRVLPLEPYVFDKNRMYAKLHDIVHFESGLVIIGGTTASGKTSFLASLLDHINRKQNRHVFTVESSIRYLHKPQLCEFTQQVVGLDQPSINQALGRCNLKNPQIIYVSDIEDYETINLALQQAETGKLVFLRVNQLDAFSTTNWLVSQTPDDQRDYFRTRLASQLRAVVMQRLVPVFNFTKILPIYEFFLNDRDFQRCIKTDYQFSSINRLISDGYGSGKSQSFDQDFVDCFNNKLIDEASAHYYFASVLGLTQADLVRVATSVHEGSSLDEMQKLARKRSENKVGSTGSPADLAQIQSPFASRPGHEHHGVESSTFMKKSEPDTAARAPMIQTAEHDSAVNNMPDNKFNEMPKGLAAENTGDEHSVRLDASNVSRVTKMFAEIEKKSGDGATKMIAKANEHVAGTGSIPAIDLNVGSGNLEDYAPPEKKKKLG